MLSTNKSKGKEITLKELVLTSDDKPKPFEVQFDHIPADLQGYPNWILWNWVRRDGRWNKIPISAKTRKMASTTNPETWSTFEESCKVLESCTTMAGLGFVFTSEDPFVGIDLDNSLDENGIPKDWAGDIIDNLRSYTEISPTGTGVKIFIKGKMPIWSKNRKNYQDGEIEIYQEKRYFTVTGKRLGIGTVATIEERQDQLERLCNLIFNNKEADTTEEVQPMTTAVVNVSESLSKLLEKYQGLKPKLGEDDRLIDLIRNRRGDKFIRLFDGGDLTGYNNDHSKGDHALITILADYIDNDPERLDRLFRKSKLFRPKWDSPRGDSTYGWNEIQTVLDRKSKEGACRKDPPKQQNYLPQQQFLYRPFPYHLLPEPLASLAVEGAASISPGCDPVYVALPTLAVVGSLIGNTRRLRIKRGWLEPPVIWSAIVGYSGTRKSPAMALAVNPLQEIQRDLNDQHKKELEKIKKAKKDSSNGGGNEPDPVLRRVLVNDTTIEKLVEILEDSPVGTLVFRDELDGWFQSFQRYKGSGGGSDRPQWLEMHGARSISIDRKTGDKLTIFIPHAAVSVSGSIQPDVLVKAMDKGNKESGLAARFILAMPPRLPGNWTEDELRDEVKEAFQELLIKLLKLDFNKDSNGRSRAFVIEMTEEAKKEWIHFYNDWAKIQAESTGAIASVLSKLEAYAARLALIHHVCESLGHNRDDKELLQVESIRAGIELVRWFGNEACRIYKFLDESGPEREVRELVQLIRMNEPFTVRKLQRAKRTLYPDRESAERALEVLVNLGLAQWSFGPGKNNQKTKYLTLCDSVTSVTSLNSDDQADGDQEL